MIQEEAAAPKKTAKASPTRVIGIDYGLARLGLAVSDERKIIATPMTTLKAEKKTEATVTKLLLAINAHASENNYEIETIVVGLPLLMSGKQGFFADEVTHFIEMLRDKIATPVISWDERLSSVQADRTLRESSMSRKKRSQNVDSVAALIILQNYLDSNCLTRALKQQ